MKLSASLNLVCTNRGIRPKDQISVTWTEKCKKPSSICAFTNHLQIPNEIILFYVIL